MVMAGDPIVFTFADDRDRADHVDLVGKVNEILHRTFPGWDWYPDVPPGQGVLVIKNFTLDRKGTHGMLRHLVDLPTNLEKEIVGAAREFFERYETHKTHAGRLRPEDITPLQGFIDKPEM